MDETWTPPPVPDQHTGEMCEQHPEWATCCCPEPHDVPAEATP